LIVKLIISALISANLIFMMLTLNSEWWTCYKQWFYYTWKFM